MIQEDKEQIKQLARDNGYYISDEDAQMIYKELLEEGVAITLANIIEACNKIKFKTKFFPSLSEIYQELKNLPQTQQRNEITETCELCHETGARYRDGNMYRCHCNHGQTKFADFIPNF